MEENPLYASVTELVSSINAIPTISAEGLLNTDFPDKLIVELHNHLGNVHQMVHASTEAFNATEQFLILKDAQKELDEVGDRLFEAHQHNLLNDAPYEKLAAQVRALNDLISDSVDTEYV